jgi:hypothetical protein
MGSEQSSPGPRARKWRDAAPHDWNGEPRQRPRRTLFPILLVIAALAGAAAALVFYFTCPPTPQFVSLAVSQYHDPLLPCNDFAQEDSVALTRCFGLSGDASFPAQERQQFAGRIQQLRSSSDRAVILYLNALALEHDSKLYVLPADAKPDSPGTWYALDEILDALRSCRAPHKFLILDLMRPIATPWWGVLDDDAATRVVEWLAGQENLNFRVFCPCGSGQKPLSAVGFGASVFGRYLERGLRGAADGCTGQSKNNRVSVAELIDYTTTRVARWARLRGDAQTPVVFGAGDDFELTLVPDKAPDAEPTVENPYRNEWVIRDDWLAGDFRYLPRPFQQLSARLLRWEDHCIGATKPDELQVDDLRGLRADFSRKWPQLAHHAAQETEATKAARTHREAFRKALKDAMAKLDAIAATKPVEIPESLAKSMESVADQPDDCLADVCDVLAAEPQANLSRLQLADKLVQRLARNPQPWWALMLKNLATWKQVDIWPFETIRLAFQVAVLRRELDACTPFTLAWSKREIDEARTQANKATRNLAVLLRQTHAAALAEFEESSRLYRLALDRSRAIDQLRRSCDDALAWLPAVADYIVADASPNATERCADFRAAVRLAGELDKILSAPDAVSAGDVEAAIRRARGVARPLQESLQRLQTPLETRVASALATATPKDPVQDGDLCRNVRTILRSSTLTSEQRRALWDVWQDAETRLHIESRKLDSADDGVRLPNTETPTADRNSRLASLERARRRGENTLAWIGLGLAEAEPLRERLVTAYADAARSDNSRKLDGVALDLGRLLRTTIPQHARQAKSNAEAAQWERILDPLGDYGADVTTERFPLVLSRLQQAGLLQKKGE